METYKLIKFLKGKFRGNRLLSQQIEEIIDVPNNLINGDDFDIVNYLVDNSIPTNEDYCIIKFIDGKYSKPELMLFGEFELDGEFYPMFSDVVENDYKVMCSVAYRN